MHIFYEDKYLIVCEKPIGIQSQKCSDGTDDMLSRLEEHLRSDGEDLYVGLVHRLDTATGGLMIYSKQRALTGRLSSVVASADYSKEYLAVVDGEPNLVGDELRDLLYHDKVKNKSFVVKKSRKGVKEAIAYYKTLETVSLSNRNISLVSAKLETGRTHQIRIQLSSRGNPILGDGKYGSRDNGTTCALWSHRLCFIHPVTNKKLEFVSAPPNKYPWNLFNIKLT